MGWRVRGPGPPSGAGHRGGQRPTGPRQGLLLGLLLLPAARGTPLNSFISYFEPAIYNKHEVSLQLEQHRVKRSVGPAGPLNIDFRAHNRLFRLRLQAAPHSVFAPDVAFESTQGPITFPTERVVEGYLEDEWGALVSGLVSSDGQFEGTVRAKEDTFHIEAAHRYPEAGLEPYFPLVVYREEHVSRPGTACEGEDRARRWLGKRHQPAGGFEEALARLEELGAGVGGRFEAVPQPEARSARPGAGKEKRASGDFLDRKKTTCMLYLQADHLFYEKMGQSEEACIEVMTRHVQSVNSIYRAIDFDLDGKPDNISFMIKRIKVHTLDALEDPQYRFPGNYDVEKFLEIFSEEDYDAFCLAYMFTYRDFEGGTLGLAWTGDLKNAGGVCEKNGHYRGSFKSLNTGIITLMNYGKHVPPAVSHVTMAHEMGHNFGSPHDPEADKSCVPGGEDGNYIMFARATSGDKLNNKRFSPCSLSAINRVLQVKARGSKGCFNEPQQALCGNGVVEEGEECDCGWEEDCTEQCCWPQRTKYSSAQLPCTLRPGRQCSPSQGPCCDRNCGYSVGSQCREDNGCRDESYCDGRGTHCPPSLLKPNKTVCNEEFVCFQGECTGSICLAYGLESCQCRQGPEDQATKACELCCKAPGEDAPCVSSFQLNSAPRDIPDMYSKPGTACNQYTGYCDVFQKCREVDPLGPLLTLRRLLLSDKALATFRLFITKYWYSVILAAIAVMGLMVTIVKLCGKKTPLLERRRRRRPRSVHHEGGEPGGPVPEPVHVHPTAIKTALPFMGRTYRLEREARRREKEERRAGRRKPEAAGRPPEEPEARPREGPEALAARLGQRLMVSLPPEPAAPPIIQSAPVVIDSRRISSDEARHAVSSWLTTVSPQPEEEETEARQERRPEKEKEEGKRKRSKSVSKPQKEKEGPSKGELTGRGRKKGEEAEVEAGEEERKGVTIAKLGPFKMSVELKGGGGGGGKGEKAEKDKEKETREGKTRSRSRSKPGDERARRAGRREEDREEPEQEPTEEPRQQERRRTERIVVSKLARSDRPVRERSPEKPRSQPAREEQEEDYRLTLNRRREKFTRSVSQPGPPPSLEPAPRPPHPAAGLRRSNTLQEEVAARAEPTSGTVYDNLGFDRSPDLRTGGRAADRRQQTLAVLKDQIQVQLARAAITGPAGHSLPSTGGRARRQDYRPMREEEEAGVGEAEEGKASDSDSLSSDPRLCRQSPPTQVQSLSEESSGCSTRRRPEHRPSSPGSCRSLESLQGPGDPFGEGEGPGLQGPGTGEAANPHVRVPVPRPRTSLLRVALEEEGDGCDSDSTLDPRPRGRRGREEQWEEEGREEQWEEEEEGREEDQLSILTDGVADQMMY